MAQYAVNIEKEVSFNGAAERFSNAYTFDTGAIESFDDIPIINRIVAIEKQVFGTVVRFRSASSYGIAGPAIGNVMREIIDLSGTGTVMGLQLYRETAVEIQFELPRSFILRRRRIGRKWLHVGQAHNDNAFGPLVTTGEAPIGPASIEFYLANYARPLVQEAWSGGAEFASNGDPFTNPSVAPFLNHRQFHR